MAGHEIDRHGINQGSQTHLGVRATLQSVGRIVFRDDKMQ